MSAERLLLGYILDSHGIPKTVSTIIIDYWLLEPHPVYQYVPLFKVIRKAMYGPRWPVAHIPQVRKALDSLTRTFAIGGTMPILSAYRAGELRLTDGTSFGRFSAPDIEKLISYATPAPFGRGDKTVVDPTVRKALEIPVGPMKQGALMSMATAVREHYNALAPAGHALRPVPYKIHIYRTGDFFTSHSDTQHAPNHYATLVLVLPAKHEGGVLTVRHQGQVESFGGLPNTGRWMAFYTDCEHEVSPVTSGTRIVIQYDLYLAPQQEPDLDLWGEVICPLHDIMGECQYPGGRSTKGLECYMVHHTPEEKQRSIERAEIKRAANKDDSSHSVYDMIQTLSESGQVQSIRVLKGSGLRAAFDACLSKYPKLQVLGFLLNFRYSEASLKPEYLKPYDRQLYDLVRAEGFSARLGSVTLGLVRSMSDYGYSTAYVSSFNTEDVHAQVATVDQPIDWHSFEEPETAKLEEASVIVLEPVKSTFVDLIRHQEGAEHTGNDAMPTLYTYFSACLFVELRSAAGELNSESKSAVDVAGQSDVARTTQSQARAPNTSPKKNENKNKRKKKKSIPFPLESD